MSETTTLPTAEEKPALKRQDFISDQDVRWCPGCGDYTILFAVQNALAKIGRQPHENVFVSGIGCSSRFPYYMDTYGFHTVHGRAATIASGVKCANPELTVWMISGDGDSLSIGANHLMHILRRNIDVNILLINNRIYGLTKGQYSPCSEQGKITKTSPFGSIEQPVNPLRFALAAQATFVARTNDADTKHMAATFQRAAAHKGTSFVEIYQNCKIFNDGIYKDIYDRTVRDDRLIYIEDGKPMIFGKLKNQGLTLNGIEPAITEFDPEAGPPAELIKHDEKVESATLAYLLTQLDYPEFPVAMGVLRDVEAPVYEDQMYAQVAAAKEKFGEGTLKDLFRRGAETWTIEAAKAEGEGVTGHLEHVEASDEIGEEKESYEADIEQDAVEVGAMEKLLAGVPLAEIPGQAETIVVPRTTTVAEAVKRMCSGDALGTVLVEGEGGSIAGIVTERDLLLRLPAGVDLGAVIVAQIMTPNPETLLASDSVAHALNFMGSRNYRRIPVEGESGVKVLSIDDVLDFIHDA